MQLWAAQTVSAFGTLVSHTALPFLAVLVLKATPTQMAVLAAADLVPGLLTSLFAGVWVDRLPRRPLLIAADLGRVLLLGSVPAAACFGALRIEQLYVVAALTAVLDLLFNVAHQAYLPSLVAREELVEGNSKLASAAVAEVGGFGLSGWLVQWFGAPAAVLIDAVSFLVSALFLGAIRTPEPPPQVETSVDRPDFRREVREGMHAILRDPRLRALAVTEVLLAGSFRMFGTLFMLFVTRELGFKPAHLGMIFGIGGLSSLIGAVTVTRIGRWLGAGRTMVLGILMASLGCLPVPLAPAASLAGVACLVLNQLVTDPGCIWFEITQSSLRQAIVPDRLLGRVNASMRFAGLLASLAGVAMAGALGEVIGLRSTLLLGVAGVVLAAVMLALSPVHALREIPRVADEVPVPCGETHMELVKEVTGVPTPVSHN
jgi:MFS family permease